MVDTRAVSAAKERRALLRLRRKKRDLTKMNSPRVNGRGPRVNCDEL